MYELCSKCHTWGFPVTGVIYMIVYIWASHFSAATSECNNRFTVHKGYNRSWALTNSMPWTPLYSSYPSSRKSICLVVFFRVIVYGTSSPNCSSYGLHLNIVKCTLTCLARITGKVAASPQDSFFPLVVLYSWRLKCEKIENVCEGWA